MTKYGLINNGIVEVISFEQIEGWLELPNDVYAGYLYNQISGEFTPPEIIISDDDVDAERDKRMRSNIYFMGKYFDVSTVSLQRITGAATLAGFAIAQGAAVGDYLWHGGTTPFSWITDDNSIVQLDAHDMFNLGKLAASNETAHIFAARTLKDMSPIPQDFRDNIYWPAIGPGGS